MKTQPHQTRPVGRAAGVTRTVGLDIVAPLIVFQGARLAGAPVVWALVLSGLPPLVGLGWDWVRRRTLEVVGAVVISGIVLSVVLAAVSGDPRVVLLESVALTAAFGIGCLVSIAARRPLIFYFAQVFYGGRHSTAGRGLDQDYDTYQEARRFWRTLSVVWGLVYLAESGTRVVLVLTASPQVALTANRVIPWVVYAGLMAWSLSWGHRLSSTKPAQADDTPPP